MLIEAQHTKRRSLSPKINREVIKRRGQLLIDDNEIAQLPKYAQDDSQASYFEKSYHQFTDTNCFIGDAISERILWDFGIKEGKEHAIYIGNREDYWRNRIINSLRFSRQKKFAQTFQANIRNICYFEHNEYNWQNLPMILK